MKCFSVISLDSVKGFSKVTYQFVTPPGVVVFPQLAVAAGAFGAWIRIIWSCEHCAIKRENSC